MFTPSGSIDELIVRVKSSVLSTIKSSHTILPNPNVTLDLPALTMRLNGPE